MASAHSPRTLAVLTSGGDAPGMNAALRAVVRTALSKGARVFAVQDGYQGLVNGGDSIRPMDWDSVGGILQQGGTAIGSARCHAFRTVEGRQRAAKHLVEKGIDALVVIGGDGSLTGANIFREQWPALLQSLVDAGDIGPALAERHGKLILVGLVGSIDNDMFGTDATIGADTALHRIVEAIDAIASTAASHHRTFVVEVMGRNCGYLTLMAAVATGANWVLIPENPPDVDEWEEAMVEALSDGQGAGRRHSIVIVAEGAQDRRGNAISAHYVKQAIEERMNADTRITILGHVQRGGSPSAFDRYLATVQGYEAAEVALQASPEDEPVIIGLRNNRLIRSPMMASVEKTHSIAAMIAKHEYDLAMETRGGSFTEYWEALLTILRARPRQPETDHQRLRIAILHAGGPAPGMNTAVRAATRLAINAGYSVLGVRNGFRGLLENDVEPLEWMSVHGWVARGGAELGVSRKEPEGKELTTIAERIEEHGIDALLMIGGDAGYRTVHRLLMHRQQDPRLNVTMVCLPASINNNLPGSEHSVGSDTALNSIVHDVDKIKQSAVASHRAFIVEVMGRRCGYLALMSGLATGAERVYLPEEGITLDGLRRDVRQLTAGFENGKRLGLFIRNEQAEDFYTTDFIARLFDKEGGDLFDVRTSVLGHVQQGGNPTPYDRNIATRFAQRAVQLISDNAGNPAHPAAAVGVLDGQVRFTDMAYFPDLMDAKERRPRQQWWMDLREVLAAMSDPSED
jgi:6-phosphofructokinase 1